MSQPIQLQSQILTNHDIHNWANIKDQYMLQPIYGGPGRVLVQQDGFKSRMDCTKCEGKGHTGEVCRECKGTGTFRGKKYTDEKCTTCHILRDKSQPSSAGAWINLNGKQPCDLCNGTGSSSIVIPDEAKTDTTMGNIVAISKQGIEMVKQGDKVMYGSYIGTQFKFLDITFRVCTERDLFCLVKQLKPNVDSSSELGFQELENTGVPRE